MQDTTPEVYLSLLSGQHGNVLHHLSAQMKIDPQISILVNGNSHLYKLCGGIYFRGQQSVLFDAPQIPAGMHPFCRIPLDSSGMEPESSGMSLDSTEL